MAIRTNNITRLRIGSEVAGSSFTNVNISLTPTSPYSGSIISTSNTVDVQSGSSATNVFGIENLLYLRSGSTISNTFRALRNRLWNVQTANYPNAVGTLNEYRGEVTNITSFKGFINTYDFRAGSNTSEMMGFFNEFTGQIKGTITNYYGFYSGIHSSEGSLSMKYDTTGTNTGIYNITDSNYTVRIFNLVSSINLPNPNTCKGRIYILIGSNGIDTKSITVSGGGVIYDDVLNSTINTISSGQRYQIQSDSKDWIVIGN